MEKQSLCLRVFRPNDNVTALQAKNLFFLTVDDLSSLNFHRPQGFGAYAMRTGACKLYSASEVQALAIQKYGIDGFKAKENSKGKREENKRAKRVSEMQAEEQRRLDALAAAERAKIAAAEAKAAAKQAQLEQAAAQKRACVGWAALLAATGSSHLDEVQISQLVADARAWRSHCANTVAAQDVAAPVAAGAGLEPGPSESRKRKADQDREALGRVQQVQQPSILVL